MAHETATSPTPRQPPLVQGLLDPAAYPHPTDTVSLIETHISWVFVAGAFVYKVKKPCDLGFLDFTTLDRRRHFCHEEVRLSGRFAPSLYLGVVPITGTPAAPRVDGTGEPIEWAVKLARFAESQRLDHVFAAGRLGAADCERLGIAIARVQTGLAVADAAAGLGTARSVEAAAAVVLDHIRTHRPDAAAAADRLGSWLRDRLDAARERIAARIDRGRIRECHGDLHLANIVIHEGRAVAFDAIEFDPALRWIDAANDIAFLAMDLRARERPDLAAHVVNGWIEEADDHDAVAVLPIYEVYRAVVRAAVAAIRGTQAGRDADAAAAARARAETERYLDLAVGLTAPRRPILCVTTGVSGSGKSTLAAELVGGLEAVRLRSDVERKRISGMAPTDRPADARAAEALYDEGVTRRAYERLAALARTVLAAGRSVVVDAAGNARWQREMLVAAARDTRVPLVMLDFDLPVETVIDRVAAREATGHDPSDASAAVVRAQVAAREPITAEELRAGQGAGTPARIVRIGAVESSDPGFARRLTRQLAAGTEP